MVNKKAYLRTIEVVIAVLATFMFVVYVMPTYVTGETPAESVDLLISIADNIRDCQNISCVDSAVSSFDPVFVKRYDYIINISSDPNAIVSGLPRKDIYIDSVYIAGNISNYDPKIIKLYYWER